MHRKLFSFFAVLALAALSPALSSAAGTKPYFNYSRGLAFDEMAVCFAKIRMPVDAASRDTLCKTRCQASFQEVKDTTQKQDEQIRKYTTDPIRNGNSALDKRMEQAVVQDIGKNVETLKTELKDLQDRMGQPGYVLIVQDQDLMKKYQGQIVTETKTMNDAVQKEMAKTRDDLMWGLIAYLRGEPEDLAHRKSSNDLRAQGQKTYDACVSSCGQQESLAVKSCQTDFEKLKKTKCDADYAEGVQYCEQYNSPAQASVYISCNRDYLKSRASCYVAKSTYSLKDYFYNRDNKDIFAHRSEWPASLAQYDEEQNALFDADKKASADRTFAFKADLATKVSGVEKFLDDWVTSWIGRRQNQQNGTAANDADIKKLEPLRIDAVVKNTELTTAEDDAKFIEKKRQKMANKDKSAKPLASDAGKEAVIAKDMGSKLPASKEKVQPNPTEKEGWLGWGYNRTLDLIEFTPKLGTYVKSARESAQRTEDDIKLQADKNMSQTEKDDIAFARKVGLYLDKITEYSPIPLPLPPVGKILEAGVLVYTRDTSQTDVGGDALSRDHSPGLKFQDAWNGNDKGKELRFEIKDRKGSVTDVVSLPTGPYWRQLGKDDAPVVWLWPIADGNEAAQPTGPYKIRVNQESHVVDLVKVNEYLTEVNGKAVKSREIELLGSWPF